MLHFTEVKPRVLSRFSGADIQYTRRNRLDIAACTNLPITLVFLPASDIAKYVGQGNVDLGITGQDIVIETGIDVENVLDLGKCVISNHDIKDLENAIFRSKYP